MFCYLGYNLYKTNMQWETLYYFFIFATGLAFGSFLNVLVWRVRENLSVVVSRSICPKCRLNIAWYDNIPLLSFLILGGKCRKCKCKISAQYPLVEAWVGIIFVILAMWHSAGIGFPIVTVGLIRDWAVMFFLSFIFLYDLRYGEILDRATTVPGVLLFVLSFLFGWKTWQSMSLGVLIGAGFFLLLYIVSKGRWIGGGDIRMGFFMGVILGWPCIVVALFIAYVSGAAFSLLLIALKKKTMKSETAFGTYLVLGTMVSMFWCDHILKWYFGLIG